MQSSTTEREDQEEETENQLDKEQRDITSPDTPSSLDASTPQSIEYVFVFINHFNIEKKKLVK